MKTKKLLFLTTILMVFAFVSAVAQRGTCTTTGTLSDQYYRIGGVQTHDYGSSTSNATIPTVPIGALVQVGIRNSGTELDNSPVSTFTIVVKKDGVVTSTIVKGVGSYGTLWQPTIPATNFTAGAVVTAEMTVTPSAAGFGGCTAAAPWTYTYTFKTATGCLPATPTFFYNNNNGSNWVDPATVTSNAITVPSIPIAGNVVLGVYPNGGTFAFSDGLGFTATSGTGKYQFTYNPGFTDGGQTRDVTAVFTDNCGGKTNYVYHISSTTVCTPVAPIPYYNISGWVNKLTTDTTINLDMAIGQKITLGINPSSGTVAWTGCNGFTGSTREFLFDPGFTAAGQSCSITGAYKDICGVVTNYTYNLSVPTVCTPATPTFYYSADNGATWNDPTTPVANNIDVPTLISLGGTGKITPGMHLNGGSVTWSDGLGFSSTSNQPDYFPNFTTAGETRTLTAAYLDTCGNTTNYTYTLHAAATCSPSVPTFYYNTGDGNWHDSPGALLASSPLTIAPTQVAGTVTIGVHLNGGSITWTDDNATTPFTGTASQFTYNPGFTAGGQTRTLTGAYLDSCGNTTNFVYSLSSALVCVPNTPTFFYNNGSGWVDPATVAGDNSITIPAVFASGTFSPTLGIGVRLNGGSITWSDATGGTIDKPNNNQITYSPAFTDGGQTRTLTGAYVDTCGNTTNYIYNISSTSTCVSIAPIPNYNIDGVWKNTLTTSNTSIDVNLPIGSSTVLEIKPGNGDSNGTFSWTDTLGLYTNEPTGQVSYNAPDETFDVTGVYADKCGTATTYVFHIKSITLGIDKFEQGGFRMYPNPADTNLNVVYNGDLKVSIVNASGQQILSPRSISKQGSIDVSSLSSGVYFLKAVANGESTVKKFVKK
jgi:hypothetical protein